VPYAADLYYCAYHPKDTKRLPIVLIHGAGGDHHHWPVQVRRLPGYRIYALDLPGHGKSTGHGIHQISDYAERVFEWMDEISLHKAVLVGHSMGGAISLQMGIQYPERVLGLGLAGTGAKLPVNASFLENTAHETTFQSAVEFLVSWAFSPSTNPKLVKAVQQQMLKTRPTVMHGDFVACDSFDERERLGEIEYPTQVICGSDDKLMPVKYSQFLADHIPSAKLDLIPETGHMVMLEKPERFATALKKLLTRI